MIGETYSMRTIPMRYIPETIKDTGKRVCIQTFKELDLMVENRSSLVIYSKKVIHPKLVIPVTIRNNVFNKKIIRQSILNN